jgi:hypothetical protein
MDAVLTSPLYIGCTLTLFVVLALLLLWRQRKASARRRIRRGLKVYTAGSQVLS